MQFLLRTIANAAALAVATWLFSGISLTEGTLVGNILTMLIVAVIFGLFNSILKPIFQIVTIPIWVLTLGLFLIVINAWMLMLTSWIAGMVGIGWHVSGFWTAVGGSLVVSIVSFIVNGVLGTGKRDQ